MGGRYEIVVIGTSWGGLRALKTLVGALPADFGIPVVIVQHRHRDSDNALATLLQECTASPVCEVEDKQPIEAGHVFIAPPDYHLLVEEGWLALSTDAPVRFSRPSIDVTLMSAADVYARAAVGVVLTGANADGARGLAHVIARGGLALVQDPAEAVSPTMPAAAALAAPTAKVLRIAELARALGALPSATTAGEGRR